MSVCTIESHDKEFAATFTRLFTLDALQPYLRGDQTSSSEPLLHMVHASDTLMIYDTPNRQLLHQCSLPLSIRSIIAVVGALLAGKRQAIPLSESLFLHMVARTLNHHPSGQIIPLTEKETALLACLSASPEGMSKDRLLSQVWGYHPDVESRTLETHLYRLRQKLQHHPECGLQIMADQGQYGVRMHEGKGESSSSF